MEQFGFNIWMGVVVSFAVAAIIVWINGIPVTRARLPSLIVTLAALFVVAGLNDNISKQFVRTTQHSLPDADMVSEFILGD